jgi:hypothetical protein
LSYKEKSAEIAWRIFSLTFVEKVVSLPRKHKNGQTMSEATLQGLLDYLYSTLTPDNMRWMATHLMAHADSDEENLKPYTMEEINARIDQSERDSAEGKVYDFDDVMREIEEEFALEEKLEMAEAV